jgi:hypothetical protein
MRPRLPAGGGRNHMRHAGRPGLERHLQTVVLIVNGPKTQLGMSWRQQTCSGRLDADESVVMVPSNSEPVVCVLRLF